MQHKDDRNHNTDDPIAPSIAIPMGTAELIDDRAGMGGWIVKATSPAGVITEKRFERHADEILEKIEQTKGRTTEDGCTKEIDIDVAASKGYADYLQLGSVPLLPYEYAGNELMECAYKIGIKRAMNAPQKIAPLIGEPVALPEPEYSEAQHCSAIKGYEDIHKDEPYIDAEHPECEEVAHVFTLYVPPNMRGRGVGAAVFQEWVDSLPNTVIRIRLMAATLGGSDSLTFWKKLGFTEAYTGNLYSEIENALVLGINGYANPEPEYIGPDDLDRHWIEGQEDRVHLSQNPQYSAKSGASLGF